jgi:uncharacterized protein (TIGR00255 family)
MIYSMTGFGQAKGTYNGKTIKVEIKSLNGKTTDLRLKMPTSYKSKEIAIRNQILNIAIRGKVDTNISIESALGDEIYSIRAELFRQYYNELNSVSDELNIQNGDVLQSIMRIPGVLYQKEVEFSPEEWEAVQSIITNALNQFNEFRLSEGDAMFEDLKNNLDNIRASLKSVDEHEENRVTKLKDRIRKNLEQFIQDEGVDKNRYEQEILYYLEKLDINEEKMRLAQHCNYFEEVINENKPSKGKKLAFISQEMGREINTMGAKAQEHNIQQIVVNMKDDLEKIKEMMANVL